MADDSDSIFAKAGFDVPAAKDKSGTKSLPPVVVTEGGDSPKSIFESAGFQLPDKSAAPAPTTTWKDAEALENLAALGGGTSSPPAKPRGIAQALKDYLPHVLSGVEDTLAAPGNVLASSTPSTSESLIPNALSLAGMVTGGEFPRAGVATVAQKLSPTSQATNALVKAIGPENMQEAVNRLQANPRLTLADVSDPVRTMTQGLVDPAQPKAQNAIVSAVKDRIGSRLDATNTAFTDAMGPAPDVLKMVEGLKDRARTAGREAIQPALENAKPVDVSPVIRAIDEKLKPGITALMGDTKLPLSPIEQELIRVKSRLTDGENQVFDAKKLHEIQSDIGDQAYQYSKSLDPKDKRLGSHLRDVNEKLIDQIDAAAGPVPLAPGNVRVGVQGGTKYVDVPSGRSGLEKLADPDFIAKNAQPADAGAYRAARAKFKDAKDISEAFETGFDTLKNRGGLKGAEEDSPQAFREWMKDATPEEVVARRLGTRADIDQKINSVKNGALKGETITQIPYNQEKLRSLFGDNEANRLIRVMKDSQDEALTNAKILANSKTAETLAGQRALEVPKIGGGNPLQYFAPVAAEIMGQSAGLPGIGFAASIAAKGIHTGAQKLSQMNALARNESFARGALASGPARQETINALLSHPKVIRELKKSGNALTAP